MNLIFDFDGTIADTTPFFFTMANEIAKDLNFPSISQTQFDKARDAPPKQTLKELRIPVRALPKLRKASHAIFQTKMDEIELISGMREVIQQLALDHTLGILTSNDADIVHRVLQRLELDSEFTFINSAVSVFGKHRALKKIIKRHSFDQTETYYIGDEVRDIEGAQKAGLNSIAVTWGFNTKKLLLEYKPDLLIENPSELLTIR